MHGVYSTLFLRKVNSFLDKKDKMVQKIMHISMHIFIFYATITRSAKRDIPGL